MTTSRTLPPSGDFADKQYQQWVGPGREALPKPKEKREEWSSVKEKVGEIDKRWQELQTRRQFLEGMLDDIAKEAEAVAEGGFSLLAKGKLPQLARGAKREMEWLRREEGELIKKLQRLVAQESVERGTLEAYNPDNPDA